MKDIKNYEGLYAITEDGQVWSYKNKIFLKPFDNGKGYLKVDLCKDGKEQFWYIHRLVAEAYIPNPNNYETVDHINNNSKDNRVDNLQWMTRGNNARKAISKPVYCIELEKVFPSQKAAAKELGLDQGNISKVCRGVIHKTGGYHFRYWEG